MLRTLEQVLVLSTNYTSSGPLRDVFTQTYEYDALARNTKIIGQQGASAAFNTLTYAFDALNRITTLASVDGTTQHNYDGAGQLVFADHTAAGGKVLPTDEGYTLDLNGNRTQTNRGGLKTVENHLQNRVYRDGDFEYQHNAEGQLVTRWRMVGATRTSERVENVYDPRGRQTLATQFNSSNQKTYEVAYEYDAFNRRTARIERTFNPGTGALTGVIVERFVYDGTDVVLDLRGSGATESAAEAALVVKTRYLWADHARSGETSLLLAQEDVTGTTPVVANVLWAFVDHQSTLRDLVRLNAGTFTLYSSAHYVFDSFGRFITGKENGATVTTPTLTRYLFTSQEYDTRLRTIHYGGREYNPDSGRFTTVDPLGFAAGDTNLQRYTGNDPVNHTDPTGMQVPYGPQRPPNQVPFGSQQPQEPTDEQPPPGADGYHGYVPSPDGGYNLELTPDVDPSVLRNLERNKNYKHHRGPVLPIGPDPECQPGRPATKEEKALARFILGFIPYLGEGLDWMEVITGEDAATGEPLTPLERIITGGAGVLPFVGGSAGRWLLKKFVGKADEAIEGAKDLAKAIPDNTPSPATLPPTPSPKNSVTPSPKGSGTGSIQNNATPSGSNVPGAPNPATPGTPGQPKAGSGAKPTSPELEPSGTSTADKAREAKTGAEAKNSGGGGPQNPSGSSNPPNNSGGGSPDPEPRSADAKPKKPKNTHITKTESEAAAMAEAWKQGQTTRPLIDRATGKVIGEITEDGKRVIRYPHSDKGTPQLHWNLEDKTTGENIHVVIQ
ncbi:MAG: RHS repeat-associated core domain-containing protein [Pirellulales bacterium]|nr:RHS repeat-associated core domain-containing protein [Pirellulales bacterium]